MVICNISKRFNCLIERFAKTVYPVCYQETAETKTTELIVSCCGMTPEFADQSVHKAFYRNTAPFREGIKDIYIVCIACSFKHNSFLRVLFKKPQDTSPVFLGIPQCFPDFFKPDPGYVRMIT